MFVLTANRRSQEATSPKYVGCNAGHAAWLMAAAPPLWIPGLRPGNTVGDGNNPIAWNGGGGTMQTGVHSRPSSTKETTSVSPTTR